MLKELKRIRQRPHGISVAALALGKKVAKEEEVLLVRSLIDVICSI